VTESSALEGTPQPRRRARRRTFDGRGDRILFGAVSLAILLVPLRDLIAAWPGDVLGLLGQDFNTVVDSGAHWLASGVFYPPSELQGPFPDNGYTIVYPPVALWLFAPLSVLPRALAAALWWGFPVVVLIWQWRHFRPKPVIWPFLALAAAWPPTTVYVVAGNGAIIVLGLLALATVYAWPAVLIAVKTSVLPFAFWGVWRRSWWIAAGGLVLASIPFGLLWRDWIVVLANSRIGGPLHSWQQGPTLLFALLVWFGRSGGPIDRSKSGRDGVAAD